MNLISAHIFPLIFLFSSLVAATNFAQCLEDFRNDSNAVGGVDFQGYPTSPASAVGLTYKTCTARCGSDAESFAWNDFAQLFAWWFLPWLALTSELPFGSGSYVDDLASIAINVGSPALAAYTLVLTALNGRSVYRRAYRIKHESRTAVARALISLQQIPLELTKDDRLLAFISINDQWRREIIDRLNRRDPWSLTTGSSVAWVVIAFALALVDSFVTFDTADQVSGGHAIGTLWLWLLCLAVGWSWVPTFTSGELKSALRHANRKAARGAEKAVRRLKEVHNTHNPARTKITNRIPRVPIPKGFKKPVVDSVPEAPQENEEVKEGSAQEDAKRAGKETDQRANPLGDLTHDQPTVSSQVPLESQQGHGHPDVGANSAANQSVVSLPHSVAHSSQSSIHPDRDRLLIPKENFGPLDRDEFRLAATFNYSRVMRYLVLVDDVMTALNKLTRGKDEERPVSETTNTPRAENVVFPPGAFVSMVKASILALILQCGTTAAAVIILFFTPTVGLGCHSLGYIIYGATAILIMFLTIISTIFARISETTHDRSFAGFTAFIAIALRRMSLLLAFINAAGLVILSCLHLSDFLNSCYCNASVIGRGTDSYIIFSYEGWTQTMRNSRIVATVLSAVSMAIYMVSLWMASALPVAIDDL